MAERPTIALWTLFYMKNDSMIIIYRLVFKSLSHINAARILKLDNIAFNWISRSLKARSNGHNTCRNICCEPMLRPFDHPVL